MSPAGLGLLIRLEGVRGQVYDDRTGKPVSSYAEVQGTPTIGVGHAIQSPSDQTRFAPYLAGTGRRLTDGEALALLREDIGRYERPVAVRLTRALSPPQFDALVSLAYNAGPNAAAVLRATEAANRGDDTAAADAIRHGPTTSRGRSLPGLVRRRNLEADLYLGRSTPRSSTSSSGEGAGGLFVFGGLGLVALGVAARAGKKPSADSRQPGKKRRRTRP